MNIYENIAFGLKLKKLPKEEIRKKVKHVLDMVDLEGFEDRKISTLSGGQQQRIAIARALVNEPEILMLDEPLGALDLKMRKEMQIELKNMHDQLGITFIYVTHDQEEALTMSDKIVVLSEGKIQQIGTPEDIYNEPKNAFVADFIGESNIFKGIMTGHMKVRFCGGEFVGMDDVPEGTLVDGVFAYTHPFGCSQLGDDQENTRKILASLANHPNAGGVLIVSLGCENTNVKKSHKISCESAEIK